MRDDTNVNGGMYHKSLLSFLGVYVVFQVQTHNKSGSVFIQVPEARSAPGEPAVVQCRLRAFLQQIWIYT